MITVKASQKIFTYTEVANLTGFAPSISTISRSAIAWASLHVPPRALEMRPDSGCSHHGI